MTGRLFDTPQQARDFFLAYQGHALLSHAFDCQQQRHQRRISYINNLHINPTNLCVYACKFCDFARRPGQPGAYSLDEEQILGRIEQARPQEVHIVGGMWKSWPLQRYLSLIRQIATRFPNIAIKACTAVEIAWFAHMQRCSSREVLLALQDAGVSMLPGGGAEVLSNRIHQTLHKDKISPAQWLAIHREAHNIGLASNASMLFGHIETLDEILEHLHAIRELQDETSGFTSFVPLLYQPGNTQLGNKLPPHKALDIIALCRLYLDNVDHIKAYWPTLGLATAAMALTAGANDLDGTLGQETIMQMANADAPAQLSEHTLCQLIRDAGMQSARRDGQHRLLT